MTQSSLGCKDKDILKYVPKSLFSFFGQNPEESPGGSKVDKMPAMQEMWVFIPGSERSPGVGNVTNSRFLA